jgi:DNA-binding CsgD family transcriptional regulator
MLDSAVSSLLGRIYATGADPDALGHVLDDVLHRTGSRRAFLATADPRNGTMLRMHWHGDLGGATLDGIAEYEAGAAPHDPTMPYLATHPGERFFDTGMMMTEADHAACPHMGWHRHHMTSRHWMVGHSPGADGMGFGISLHARDPQAPHDDRARRLFQLVFEHFDRATRLSANIQIAEDPGRAIVLIDAAARIARISPAAEAILMRSDGLAVRDHRLMAANRNTQRLLDRLIASAITAIEQGGWGGALRIERPSGARGLAVTIDPLPAQTGLARFVGGAVVHIVDPDAGAPVGGAARWRAIWGLTAAEAQLLLTMSGNGCDLRDAADRQGIAYSTVRTQLASIFAKTGTNGQPDLMRLLARLSG